MPVNLRGRNFLKLLDYSPAEIRYLLDLSRTFKDLKRTGTPHRYLEGKNIVLLFEKTSTRTRCSFEVAGMDLGMGVTYLDPGSSQMGKKESIADTAKLESNQYIIVINQITHFRISPHRCFHLTTVYATISGKVEHNGLSVQTGIFHA